MKRKLLCAKEKFKGKSAFTFLKEYKEKIRKLLIKQTKKNRIKQTLSITNSEPPTLFIQNDYTDFEV